MACNGEKSENEIQYTVHRVLRKNHEKSAEYSQKGQKVKQVERHGWVRLFIMTQ